MENSLIERQQARQAQVDRTRETIAELEGKLREIDSELEGLSGQRLQYQLLGNVSDSLDKLSEMGAAALFWGESTQGFNVEARLAEVRDDVGRFRERISAIESSRQPILDEIETKQDELDVLHEHLAEIEEAIENAKYEFVIEREARELPFRPAILPWDLQGEDKKRFRKILLLCLLGMLVVGGLPQIWTLPEPDKNEPVKVPERLARMVKKKKIQPPKPKKVQEAKKEEEKKPDEKKPKEQKKQKPTPTEVKQARAVAETKGVLAFKNSFSDMMSDDIPSDMSVDSKLSNAGNQAPGGASGSRSLIVAAAGAGSGGVASSSISRGGIGNGSGGAISGGGVSTGHVTSAISTMKGDDRPLSSGVGPARTDQEIQIVFDRYKATLYRIYNRELRNDPTLRGKMVLALTIEPDGRVSACRVKSTDLDSPTLSKKIVERVMRFNFGAKEGVPTTKILYPIDFLPAG